MHSLPVNLSFVASHLSWGGGAPDDKDSMNYIYIVIHSFCLGISSVTRTYKGKVIRKSNNAT